MAGAQPPRATNGGSSSPQRAALTMAVTWMDASDRPGLRFQGLGADSFSAKGFIFSANDLSSLSLSSTAISS